MRLLFGNLRNKLLLALIIITVIPVGIMVVVNILGTSQLISDEVENNQLETTRIITGQVNEFIDGITNNLQDIGQAGLELDLDNQQLNAYLLTYLSSDASFYDTLWLMDAEGNELARASHEDVIAPRDLQNRHEEEVFFRPERGETYFSTVRLLESEPQISISLPLYDGDVFIGAMAAIINLQDPWSIIRDLTLGEGGYALLVDRRGNLIVHRDQAVLDQRLNLATIPVISNALQESQKSALYRYTSAITNAEVLGSAVLIPETGWVLAIERPTEEALRAESQARQNAFISVGISLLLAIGISLFIARQITRPVLALRDAAQQFGSGNFNLRAAVSSQDEIGELAQSFNSMAQQVTVLIDSLEERVAARTRDLELAAEVSQEAASVVDPQVLLPRVAELTRKSFNLYHVSIFLYDRKTNLLRLEAGTGEAGSRLKEMDERFNLDTTEGLVFQAARNLAPVLINDTENSTEYLKVSLLPDTRSEIALPMTVAGNLIGVLDLQSEEVNHFTNDDLRVMQTLADRLAVAVRNAQLFAETQAAREQAEQADRVKSAFLASMSHELRTPLNGIINFTGFMLDGMLGPVTEKQQKFLSDVLSNSHHLLALINDVLDISKIESGGLRLFVEDNINLEEELTKVVRNTENLLSEKTVEVITDIDPNLPNMSGDKRRIYQIMLNLVSNACKFTQEGSVIISAKTDEDNILITVKDTGPGIAPEEHEVIFQTFTQTETGLRKGGGTGLGLPISRRLAEAHGGHLWLESELGTGAIFFVSLPIHATVIQPEPVT